MVILVTGATGNVGSNVVRELREIAVPVRAFVRDAERARDVLGDDVTLAVGDFADASSVRAAVDGVRRVFLSSADGPDKVAHETVVVDAARSAGVELAVKCSTIGAEVGSALPPFEWHGRIEEHLAQSGVPAVVLRSCFFMQTCSPRPSRSARSPGRTRGRGPHRHDRSARYGRGGRADPRRDRARRPRVRPHRAGAHPVRGCRGRPDHGDGEPRGVRRRPGRGGARRARGGRDAGGGSSRT